MKKKLHVINVDSGVDYRQRHLEHLPLYITPLGAAAQAQGTETAALRENTSSLLQIFEATWTRQPEAVALQTRREAASAQQRATSAWTPEPPALEFSNKSDRLYRNQGAREIELGVDDLVLAGLVFEAAR